MTNLVPTFRESIVCPASPGNPRNGEGCIVALSDGRLLLGWTRFIGEGRDHSPAEIWGLISKDGGTTWGEPFLLQENVGGCNVMSASFLRLHSGDLLFGFLVKNHRTKDCRYYVRRSSDEGQSWSKMVLATPEEGYYSIHNDRLLQIGGGRVLIPAPKSKWSTQNPDKEVEVTSCFFSDDDGGTWQRSAEYLELPGSGTLTEPGIVECADGSLWMYMRTDQGYIYDTRSTDGGENWSPAQPTELIAPYAPAMAKRLPDSGDILIVYNDRSGVPFSSDRSSEFQWRNPLASAVSSDGGRTWKHRKIVEADRTKTYCYTSMAFHQDVTLLTYYLGRVGGRVLYDLKLKVVPTSAWTQEP